MLEESLILANQLQLWASGLATFEIVFNVNGGTGLQPSLVQIKIDVVFLAK